MNHVTKCTICLLAACWCTCAALAEAPPEKAKDLGKSVAVVMATTSISASDTLFVPSTIMSAVNYVGRWPDGHPTRGALVGRKKG